MAEVAEKKMSASNVLAVTSSGHTSVSSNSREELQPPSGETGPSGRESYTTDFPDSTKGTAQLSPPDPAGTPLFSFDTTMNTEFPDLAEREFLILSLHVGGPSSLSQKNEGMYQHQDLYQRIEERLRSYQAESETKRKGMQQRGSSTRRASENPFPKRTAERNGLEKKPSTSEPSF
jgi:hypothetical protein